jgi:hypothetical protein
MKVNKHIAVPALALAAGISLAACGTTTVTAPPAAPAATTPAAQAPVIINNNPAPVAPAPVYVAPAQSDPWSVAVAYTNDINSSDNWGAWNLLSASVQQGWNGDYDTYVNNFNPLSYDNVTESSESGDAVTFTFDLDNHSTGYDEPYTCTFTVDNGIITSSTSYEN